MFWYLEYGPHYEINELFQKILIKMNLELEYINTWYCTILLFKKDWYECQEEMLACMHCSDDLLVLESTHCSDRIHPSMKKMPFNPFQIFTNASFYIFYSSLLWPVFLLKNENFLLGRNVYVYILFLFYESLVVL